MRLKTLGAAVVALLELSATAASAAIFHAEKENVIVTGTSPANTSQTATYSGGPQVSCSHLHLEGTQAGVDHEGSYTDESTTLHPIYGGSAGTGNTAGKCDSFLGNETTEVKTNGCHGRLYAETTGGLAPIDIECPEGQAIEVKASTCVIKFGSQSGLGTVTYTNEGSGSARVVRNQFLLEGVAYTSNDAFTCTVAGLKALGTATYQGKTVVSGYEDEGGVTGEYHEGAQVGIWRE